MGFIRKAAIIKKHNSKNNNNEKTFNKIDLMDKNN